MFPFIRVHLPHASFVSWERALAPHPHQGDQPGRTSSLVPSGLPNGPYKNLELVLTIILGIS